MFCVVTSFYQIFVRYAHLFYFLALSVAHPNIYYRTNSFRTSTPSRVIPEAKKERIQTFRLESFGADYGARTRHLDLGKVALYQMS